MSVSPNDVLEQQLLNDPAGADFPLPLSATFYPLGFPLHLETNSPDVLAAASENWGHFSPAFTEAAARIRLAVSESDTMLSPTRSVFRSSGHLMSMFADQENFMVLDFSQRFAFGWVTRAVASDHPLLRYRFLTAAATMLVEQIALAPLHGALIAREGCGVMLCGESCGGKSTLSYACARAGWTFVSDDGTFLVRNRSDRYAIGNPYSLRLREDALRFFPELAGQLAVVRPNGKVAVELFTRELPVRTALGSSIEHIVFLDRKDSGGVHLRPYNQHFAAREFERFCSFGTTDVRAAQKGCYQRLLSAGLWELRYARLDDAIVRLEELADTGG